MTHFEVSCLEADFWVRRGDEKDLPACTAIAKEVFPPGWGFVTFGYKIQGFILESRVHGIVGYLVLNMADLSINDVAVLHEHRNKSYLLLDLVVEACRASKGFWTCEARKSTSYRLLHLYAKRGKVVIHGELPTHHMNGEPMYRLLFSVK